MSTSDAPSGAAPPNEAVLQVSEVQVERLFGIDHGLEITALCSGINVICGPNASGKTTLAEAIRGMLWPAQLEGESPIIEGQFRVDGSRWHVALEGRRAAYQRDGTEAERPSLPPEAHHDRYHLYLHDLLVATGRDGSKLAEVILQEAVGGYDVEGAASELGYEVRSRTKGLQEAQDVIEARERVREAERTQDELQRQQQKLDDYRSALEAARRAERRASALSKALDVAEARAELDEVEARLNQYPEALANVRGDELEDLETLQERRDALERKREEAAADEEAAREKIENNPLPDEGLPDGFLETLSGRITELRDAEQALNAAERELRATEEEEQQAWERLALGEEKETVASVDRPDVQSAERLARSVEETQGRKEAFETLGELLLGEASSEELSSESLEKESETLREGLRHLHRWLQVASPGRGAGWTLWLIVGAGAAVALIGGGLAFLAEGVSAGVGVVLVLLGIAIIGSGLLLRNGDGGDRDAYEGAFNRLGLDAPESWTQEDVENRADELHGRWRRKTLQAEEVDEWERSKGEREEIEEELRQLNSNRENLEEELGLALDLGGRGLHWILERLQSWQSAYERAEALREKKRAAEQEVEEALDECQSAIGPYSDGEVEDASEAEGVKAALESAQSELQEARRDLEEARRREKEASTELEEVRGAIEELYRSLDLEVGEEEALRALVSDQEAYEEAKEARREAKTRVDTKREALRRLEGHQEWMETAATADLETELENAEQEASEKEDILERINTIETRVEDAKEGSSLEEQRAEYRKRRARLQEQREADYRKAVGTALADWVQEKTQDRDLPSVFQRAQALFADITGGRYELALDRSGPRFRAVDAKGRGVPLDALSSGTKVQLLLAVRIAFVEEQERGYRLPLVLDEVLANSDDEKARSIIRAVETISKQGRQVLYLTAQRDEVAKWQATLEQNGNGVPLETVALGDAFGRTPAGGTSAEGDGSIGTPVRPAPEERPDPETTSHEEYGRELGVPRWSPRDPVGSIHLWYLLDDVEALDRLVGNGVQTWGQLRALWRHGGHDAELDDASFKRVKALADAAEAWKEAWLVGRGRPVDRAALDATDAVTDTFIDRVTSLAKDLDGDAERLLEELRTRDDERAKRFHDANADALEEYLIAEGYLGTRDVLTEEEQWQRVLAATAEERSEDVLDADALEALFGRIEEGSGRPAEE